MTDRAALLMDLADRAPDMLAAARRLTAGSFRRDGEWLEADRQPRFSIPCRPDYDDDMVLVKWIEDAAAALRALASGAPR